MAKEILHEVKDSINKNYIGRFFYKSSYRFLLRYGLYFAEVEDLRNGNKKKEKLGFKNTEFGYPFTRWDVELESMKFTDKGLEVKCKGLGRRKDEVIISRPTFP